MKRVIWSHCAAPWCNILDIAGRRAVAFRKFHVRLDKVQR